MVLLASKRIGARVDGMVSRCERSINVVTVNKPKRLTGLRQKALWWVQGLRVYPAMDNQHHRRIERT